MYRFKDDLKPIAQKLFDQMVTKIIKQGQPSTIGSPLETQRCALRGVGGTCCSVGALIKDELFNPYYNGLNPTSAQVLGMVAASQGVSQDTLAGGWFPNFIKDCQHVHDDAFRDGDFFVARVTAGFKDVALTYNLTMPAVA